MKIVHMTSSHPADDVRIFHKECKSLGLAGHDVTLVACGQTPSEQVTNGAQVVVLGPCFADRWRRLLVNSRLVLRKALAIDAHIYHIHDPELLVFARVIKRRGKKVVYDAHEDLPLQLMGKPWIPYGLRPLASWAVEQLEDLCLRHVDAVIAATPAIKDRLLKKAKRVIGCFNYPLIAEYGSLSRRSPDKNRFCYVGVISEARGIKEIIEAAETANMRLDLCGRFEPPALQAQVEAMSGWKMVDYHGPVDRSRLLAILSRSVAGVVTFLPLPNHVRSLPNKLFEYMAAGVPVVASNFVEWRAVVEPSCAGICVDPSSPDEIAMALCSIASDESMARRMGENGRHLIEVELNWEREADKLIRLYEEI